MVEARDARSHRAGTPPFSGRPPERARGRPGVPHGASARAGSACWPRGRALDEGGIVRGRIRAALLPLVAAASAVVVSLAVALAVGPALSTALVGPLPDEQAL